MPEFRSALQDGPPLVVGSVGAREVLDTEIAPGDCDLIELRLDVLGTGPEVRIFAERHAEAFPILLTARHPEEGGLHNLSAESRAEALASLLDLAAAIDLELRSLDEMAGIWAEAGRREVVRIASQHDFEACPPMKELLSSVNAMQQHHADLAKLAFRIVEPGDLHTLVGLLRLQPPIALAAMGMGPLAPSSRLLAAQFGSILNYGFLGEAPTAPGQWPAKLLKEAIGKCEILG